MRSVVALLVTSLAALAVSGPASAADLEGRWEFGVREATVRDLTGHGHPIQLRGSWSRSDGRAGSAAVRFRSTSLGETTEDRSLDPGGRTFAVSVVLRVPAGARAFEGTDSPNIVQKGRFRSPGQWKLQLTPDGGGRVQCRMKGSAGSVMVTSTVSRVAADRGWHKVSCLRRDDRVVLVVDGVRDVRVVSVGRVRSSWPMTVANNARSSSTDQFRGIIDSLAVARGAGALQRTLAATRR